MAFNLKMIAVGGGKVSAHLIEQAEEIGHEQWILNDIEACGDNREEYRVGPAPFTSEILVAYLCDYIAQKKRLAYSVWC